MFFFLFPFFFALQKCDCLGFDVVGDDRCFVHRTNTNEIMQTCNENVISSFRQKKKNMFPFDLLHWHLSNPSISRYQRRYLLISFTTNVQILIRFESCINQKNEEDKKNLPKQIFDSLCLTKIPYFYVVVLVQR